MDYKRAYFYLFNQVTDAIAEMEKGAFLEAHHTLIQAQQECERKLIEMPLGKKIPFRDDRER